MDKLCKFCFSPLLPGGECGVCRKPADYENSSESLKVGYRLGENYTLGMVHETDGEGICYIAYDSQIETKVLIKEFFPSALCEQRCADDTIVPKAGKEVQFKTTMLDFIDVFKNIYKLNNSSDILQIYDIITLNRTVYVIKEYLQGETLEQYVKRNGGKISYKTARALLAPVFETVKRLHENYIVHRGISPGIIYLSGGGAKINGYATLAMRSSQSEIKPTLEAGFAAPEQYSRVQYQGPFTDIYALAAIIYWCVTGVRPLAATERADKAMPAASDLVQSLPQHISDNLSAAMALNSLKRPESVEAFLDGFSKSVAAKQKVENSGAGAAQKIGGNKKVFYIIAAAAVVAIGALFLFVVLNKKPAQPTDSDVSGSIIAVAVPDFVGQKYEDIVRNAAYAQQFLFVSQEIFSEDYFAGEVVRQDPLAGTAYDKTQATVTLYVSKGAEKVQMPEIKGMSLENAQNELKKRNIAFDVMEVTNDGNTQAGFVQGCDKHVGDDIVITKERVIIYIAKAVETSSSAASSAAISTPPASEAASST